VFRPFSRQERDRILAAAKELLPEYRRLIAWLFLTGTRVSEALGLTYGCLDMARRSASIRQSRSEGVLGRCKTRRSVRRIPLPARLIEELADLPPAPADTLVFRGPKGGPISEQNFNKRVWHPLLDRLPGVQRLALRCSRHTYTSLAAEAGLSFPELASLLGDNAATLERHYRRFTRGFESIDVDRAIDDPERRRAPVLEPVPFVRLRGRESNPLSPEYEPGGLPVAFPATVPALRPAAAPPRRRARRSRPAGLP